MAFQTYRETPYRDWTIQHTWRTSDERPGPDGFDRIAVRGVERVEQGVTERYDTFLTRLDEIDGKRPVTPPLMSLKGHSGTREPVATASKAADRKVKKAKAAQAFSQPLLFED